MNITLLAHLALAAEVDRVYCDQITGFQIFHTLGALCHLTAELMSHDHGFEPAAGQALIPCHVTAADAAGSDAKFYFFLSGRNIRNIGIV